MIRRRVRLAVALGLTSVMAAAAVARAEQSTNGTVSIRHNFSGLFLSTHIDFNGDGQPAVEQRITLTNGLFGPSTVQGINEFVAAGPAICRNGSAGIQFSQLLDPTAPRDFVQQFSLTGDLLTLKQTSGSACLDPATGILFLDAAGEIAGGTGRLTGASGTFRLKGSASFSFFDGRDSLGPQTGVFELVIRR